MKHRPASQDNKKKQRDNDTDEDSYPQRFSNFGREKPGNPIIKPEDKKEYSKALPHKEVF